jgi:hypothetical protein
MTIQYHPAVEVDAVGTQVTMLVQPVPLKTGDIIQIVIGYG